MTLTLVPRMAKMGRPRKDEGEAGTTQIRVYDEMATQISELAMVLSKTSAQIIADAARVEIAELHEKYKPQIERVKAAQKAADDELKKAREEAGQIEKQNKPNSRRPRPGT